MTEPMIVTTPFASARHMRQIRRFAFALVVPVALALLPSASHAQSASSVDSVSSAEAIDLVEAAHRFSEFGYKSLGPQALLMAAQIALDYQARALNARPNQLVRGGRGSDTLPAFDVEALLARAQAMAPSDSAMLTLIGRLRTRLHGETRGVLRGPRLGSYTIDGGGTHEFTLTFTANAPAVVRIRAATATNLTCAVIDSRGKTLREDRSTSYCILNFKPEATGTVRVRITSAASTPSAYMLITN